MSTVLFIIGIWAGLCTFTAYCCVRVGSTHDEDWPIHEEELLERRDG